MFCAVDPPVTSGVGRLVRVDEITIPEPCHEDWESMDPQQRGRFCHSCRKKVHNLSSMTEREARALLDNDRDICVAYFEDDGRVAFQPEPLIPLSRLRPRHAAAPAAAGLALVLAACAPHGEAPTPRSQDGMEVVLPLQPVIPEAEPAATIEDVMETVEPSEPAEEVEPCDGTPDPAIDEPRPIKGKVRPRMGKPIRNPHPVLGSIQAMD